MTTPERLLEARRRVAGIQAALDGGQPAIIGLPREIIIEDLNLCGLHHLAAALGGARDQPTRHEAPPPNSNRRNEPMRQSTLQRPAAPLIMRTAGKFGSWPDFVRAVAKSSGPGYRDPRLVAAAATSVTSTSVGVDGGYAVPHEYLAELYTAVHAEPDLLELCDQLFTESNTIDIPVDETSPWSNNGVQANWIVEGQAIDQSKVYLQSVSLRLNKLEAIVPVTEEAMTDALGLGVYLRRRAPGAIRNKVNLALVQGSGVSQPLGILNAHALVVVEKEAAQAADSIIGANVAKMLQRLPASSYASSIWLISPDAVSQLPLLTINGAGIFVQAAGLPSGAIGLMLGRPVVPHQACAALGDKGDIILADFTQYLAVQKIGGLREEMSVHLWFDQDVTAFKFILRVAGQPWLSAPIPPRVGTMTQSPFVALAARD